MTRQLATGVTLWGMEHIPHDFVGGSTSPIVSPEALYNTNKQTSNLLLSNNVSTTSSICFRKGKPRPLYKEYIIIPCMRWGRVWVRWTLFLTVRFFIFFPNFHCSFWWFDFHLPSFPSWGFHLAGATATLPVIGFYVILCIYVPNLANNSKQSMDHMVTIIFMHVLNDKY